MKKLLFKSIKLSYLYITVSLGLLIILVNVSYAILIVNHERANVISILGIVSNVDVVCDTENWNTGISIEPGETKFIKLSLTNNYIESLNYRVKSITSSSSLVFENFGNNAISGTLPATENRDVYIAITNTGADTATFSLGVDSIRTDAQFASLGTNESSITTQGLNVAYSGTYEEFTAPYDGYYNAELWGAEGGKPIELNHDGFGGYTKSKIYLNRNEKLYIYIGQTGYVGEAYSLASPVSAYNGGGNVAVSTFNNTYAYNGGGASDIRYFEELIPSDNDLLWNSALGLKSRIMVAGGGGGVAWEAGNADEQRYAIAGGGGGLFGGDGMEGCYSGYCGQTTLSGYGGKQASLATVNGSFGIGGFAPTDRTTGGGGGGGYYGGGAGYGGVANGYSGGGGSSFISGYAGVNAINSDGTHSNNTRHYSEKYFFDGEMQIGINRGNGKAKIEFLGAVSPVRVNTNMNNAQYIKDCINGNTHDSNDGWVEFQAIHNGNNVANGIIGTLYDSSNNVATLSNASYITDGDITTENYASSSGGCYVIDLGSEYDLDEVAVWHYFEDTTSYYDNVISTSTDGTTWRTILNTFENETLQGKRVSAYRNTTHVLTIDPNDGTYNGLSTNTVVNVTEGGTSPIVDPIRDGYAFVGWTVTGTGSSINGTTFTMGSENTTLTANWEVLYYLTFNTNGGSISGVPDSYNVTSETIVLPAPTRTDYSFVGWTGTDVDTPQKDVTIPTGSVGDRSYTANWQITVTVFNYTGAVQTFDPDFAGNYQLEVWGAQGGSVSTTYYGGKGGYAKGNAYISTPIYVYVGGAGIGGTTVAVKAGGWNGGGKYTPVNGSDHWGASGGGATHIARTNRGVLSKYASYTGDVYIAAGGGGGGYDHSSGGYCGAGGAGGGATGGNGIKPTGCASGGYSGSGGTQAARAVGSYGSFYYNGSFGLGGNPGNSWGSAGGGGWYGGGGSKGGTLGNGNTAGGGGSGYIGGVSSGTMTNGSRSGNGYARITYID